MANLTAETQWHNNPRPIEAFASSVYVESVASPYYSDGRDVPVTKHTVTSVPLPTLVPTATPVEAGPADVVSFDLGGFWPVGTQFDLQISVDAGTPYSLPIVLDQAFTSAEAAAALANAINTSEAEPSMSAGVEDATRVVVTAQEPATLLTIAVLTVTLP